MTLPTDVPLIESPPGPVVTIDGRRYVYFSGTAYLCLQARSEVIAAIGLAASRTGVPARMWPQPGQCSSRKSGADTSTRRPHG